MEIVLNTINSIVWGVPALILILSVGVYFTIYTKFAQLRLFPAAIRKFTGLFKKCEHGVEGISAYRALCTALAATVGTGNIVGVAGAIALGGPGVVFWMWVCGILGMITKFAEVTLAVQYRRTNAMGKIVGGPMYMIENGLPGKMRFLGYIYCFLGVVAAFGIGNATQINAVMNGIKSISSIFHLNWGIVPCFVFTAVIAIIVMICFWSDNGRIGIWAERLVPFASILYVLLAVGVLVLRYDRIHIAIHQIIEGAFYPKTVTCGLIGSMFLSVRVGASRGVFTNEAGMGTASIAHAAADVTSPVEQGLMGIIEVFFDTIVLCTLTALAILCSGVDIPYGTDPGIKLALYAFSYVYGDWCQLFITILISLFAFATILGWGLYGVRCLQYLFGDNVWRIYGVIQTMGIIMGSIIETSIVWTFSEIVNGLMAIPNLIALIILAPEFITIIRDYIAKKAYS